ncbi:uncharacterized protein BXZ73DRAFT_89096 [Epithele typhae]|uniref:uncharacterized protein n=1 Tax=Epithele typhae TaxID=378194 RepID=UPI002007F374|nr:uncharacterized protein BXZ73DRAFT_89096 [Epithele typhae]KAH9939009.1 hypothetical protein BXZ73DRAFT_89096 [Epithele typhae]
MPNPNSHPPSGLPSSLPPPPLPASAPVPRARAQASRKRAAANDDAAYHAAAGTKRGAAERAEGDRERTKRKRVEAAAAAAAANAHVPERDERTSLVDFTALPTDALHRYLALFDLIPDLDPSPWGVEDPGPPSALLKPKSHVPGHGHALRRTSTASPGPVGVGTSANANGRSRRDPGRRRSARLVDEERVPAPPPVYGDIGDVDGMLATIAERHFRDVQVKEVDTLAEFMFKVKTIGRVRDI